MAGATVGATVGRHHSLPAVAMVILLIVFGHPLWLQALGDALVLRETPVGADAVVVLAGASPMRALHGAGLVRDGYARHLYILDEPVCSHAVCIRWSDLWQTGAVPELEALVPRPVVIPLLVGQPPPAGTYEEAVEAWPFLQAAGVRRFLLVTDESHSRRAAATWKRVVSGQAEIVSVPSSRPDVPMAGWWLHRRSIGVVLLGEVPKWLWYATTARL